MWIFCCGAKRTGASLQFDLISEVVERCEAGKRIELVSSVDFSTVHQEYKDYSGLKVFKTTQLTPEVKAEFLNNNAIGFYSYRDIRDILITMSNEAEKPLNHYIDEERYVNEYIHHFSEWQKVPNIYRSAYENFAFDIGFEIRRIQNVLNLEPLSDKIVSEISQKYALEKSISVESKGQWKSALNQEQNAIVEKTAGEWLFNYGYELVTNNPDLKLFSYSQHGEDDYVWKYFDKKKDGLVVEVGAFDGIHLSNSHALENIGWRSLCMEPTPSMYKKLIANRPKAECFNVAVVGDEDIKQIDFLTEELGLLSGVSIDMEFVKKRYEKRGLEFKEPEKIKVNAKTLNSIFHELKLKPSEIDCVTIDVEGFEMDVLRGFDMEAFKPQMIIIEANNPEHKKEIIEYIEQRNYSLSHNLEVNLIFIPKGAKSKKIVIDCKLMLQHHPLGKDFTNQARTYLKTPITTRILGKIKRILKG